MKACYPSPHASRLSEPARLDALRRTDLIDTPAEEVFDQLTRLTCRILDAPVALVSLVEDHRQFFKSTCGLSEPWASRRETPLTYSFCKHVVEAGEPLVVEDAREHPQLRDNLAIGELGVVAYLGVPLKTPEGLAIGSFSAIDHEPRAWSEGDIEQVQALAGYAMTEIALRLQAKALAAEEQARAADQAFIAASLDSLMDIFFVLGEEGQPVRWNEQMREVTGFDDEEIRAMHATDFFCPEDAPRVAEVIADVLAEGEAVVEAHVQTKSGERIPYELSGRALRDEAGELIGFCGTGRDLSERHRAAEQLKEAKEDAERARQEAEEEAERVQRVEARFSNLVRNCSDAITIVDEEGVRLYVSPAAERLFGYDAETMIGGSPFDMIHEEDLARVQEAFDVIVAEGTPATITFRYSTADGDWRWLESRVTNLLGDPSVGGIVGNTRDITERKEAEEALRESERRLRTLIETAQEGIWMLDAEGKTTFVNERMAAMIGYARKEMIGRPLGAFVDEAFRERARKRLERRKRGIREDHEICLRRRDGSELWAIASAMPSYDEEGRYVGAVGMVTDITGRKRAEDALKQSKLRFERLVNGIDGIVWEGTVDRGTGALEYTFVSDKLRDVLGYEPQGWVENAERWVEAIYEEDRSEVLRTCVEVMRKGQDHTFEYRMHVADGRVVWLRDIVSVLGEENGMYVVGGIMVDVTDHRSYEDALLEARRQAEEARREAEEMARAKSAILNNMSHEIRTPLTSIIGFAGLLAEEVPGEKVEMVKMIQRGGDRLLTTLNSVLDLAQIESGALEMRPERLDLAREAAEAAKLFEQQAKRKGITLTCEAPAGPLWAEVDRGALQRVLMNLISNAVKFTDEGGVTLHTERRGSGEEKGEVVLTVEDSGTGMEEAFLEKMFEEFRQESWGLGRAHEGSGLGLSIVRGLTDLMGGRIEVESEKGVGSKFCIRLPLGAMPSLEAGGDSAAGEEAAGPEGPTRRALLVRGPGRDAGARQAYSRADVYSQGGGHGGGGSTGGPSHAL